MITRVLASVDVQTHFVFLYVMDRFVGCFERGTGTENRMALWSETARYVSVHLVSASSPYSS